jgi:uncharacterized protein (TIGR02996 family)
MARAFDKVGHAEARMDEATFIAAILAAPRDDLPRLAFADWLEERGDLRGDFLRVAVYLEALSEQGPPSEMRAKVRRAREIGALQRRLRELRPLVPFDWAMKLARGWIEQCNVAGPGDCPRRWECLQETGDPLARRCGLCGRNVRYCWSVSEVDRALRYEQPIVKALVLEQA